MNTADLRKMIISPASWLLLLTVVCGVSLTLWAATLPEFTDEQRARELLGAMPSGQVEEFTQRWHHQMGELRTNKYPQQNFGAGVTSFALSFLVLMVWKKQSLGDLLRTAMTPSYARDFLLAEAIIGVTVIASSTQVLLRDALSRHYAPWWADTPSIPIGNAIFLILLLPFPLLVSWLLVRKSPLPVSLWFWDSGRQFRTLLWSMPFIAMLLADVIALFSAVSCGDVFSVPALMGGAYLCLALRAAIVAKGRTP